MALRDGDDEQAERLLAGEYWWDGRGLPRALIQPAQRAAQAWVGAHDRAGQLAAMARAVSDGRNAWIYDVVVERGLRRLGLGRRILALLLGHPAVRGAPFVRLRTRDATAFYQRFGFIEAGSRGHRPGTSMMLARSEVAQALPRGSA